MLNLAVSSVSDKTSDFGFSHLVEILPFDSNFCFFFGFHFDA